MNVSQGTNYLQPEYDYSATMYSSIFSRLSYDYKAKYFLDLTWRRDGSSLFGKNKRYANFWSAGAMWNIKKESFMNDFDWVNNLQLKVSYGTTGNSSISNYLSYGTIGTSSVYNGNSTWALSGVQNDDLTWETLKTFNIAINTHLFNSLDLDLEFYNKTTSDMLLEVPYSYSTGFASGWGNVGKMRNRGIDLTIGYDILNNDNFYFNVTGNFNYNKNEILDLYEGRDSYTVANTGMRYEVGHDVGEYYSVRYAGVDPATGKQLWLDKNGNITGNYSDDDSVMTGKSMYAPWSAGLQLNFSWKNLSLNAMFSGVFGKWLLNNQRYFIENSNFSSNTNQVVGMLNMWTTPGQKTEIPKAGETLQFDTHLIENASFVRLKDLQLSYSLSKKILKKTNILSGVRFYAKGRNLLTFTKYKGFDPEVDDNIALSNYPNTKQYIFGVEFTF
jgi:TonB-linked SusC/RagA family outer membrane protein